MQSAPHDRSARTIAIVASGNFFEMYDFMVFGYYATAIAAAFFPGRDAFASLMLSLGTFGAGFLMRPLGAIVLGAYVDRHGRRAGLLLTLTLMAFGTFSIAVVPGYMTLGLVAPIIVVTGRLVQGLSAGVELGGVSVYLSEIATPGRKGFFVSWQSASQQVAVVFAALLGIVITRTFTPHQMGAWGWRIPLLIGCALLPFVFMMRRTLSETAAFLGRSERPTLRQIVPSLAEHWPVVALGTMLVMMTTVSFYFITAYTPTFGSTVLNLAPIDDFIVTCSVGVSNFVLLPTMGTLSDRIGRRPILIVTTALMLLSAYPALGWLVSQPSFVRLLTVELWFSLLFASYNGAMVVYLTEIMPAVVRTTSFSFAYSLATALFGGFTPAVATYLIHATGNRAVPGLWLAGAAACSLIATCALARAERA